MKEHFKFGSLKNLYKNTANLNLGKNVKNINYSSSHQIKKIFLACGITPPTEKDTGKDTVGTESLKTFLVLNYDSLLKPFLEKYIKFKAIEKNISSFGENFINMINPISNRLHTIYRQTGAETGRFQSGDTKNNFFNSQQIPKSPEYRECFCELDGYNILTIDLSGAELVILASLSEDNYLKTILEDPHSPLATACYNEVIDYILNNFPEDRAYTELLDLFKTEIGRAHV